jgi:hypothetical protein
MTQPITYLGWDMRYTLCLALLSLTVLLGGCSRGQDEHDGLYITDADGPRFQPRIPFQNSEITSEAQKLLDDVVKKHRADGAIKSIKIETARVDATYTGILNGNFSFSGRATVTVAGAAPFTAAFRERVTGSLVAGNNRLLDHWFFPNAAEGVYTSAYVSGLDSWRTALAVETDANNMGYRLAQALSLYQLVIDLKDHADPNGIDAWKKANAIAWDQRARINLPLRQ